MGKWAFYFMTRGKTAPLLPDGTQNSETRGGARARRPHHHSKCKMQRQHLRSDNVPSPPSVTGIAHRDTGTGHRPVLTGTVRSAIYASCSRTDVRAGVTRACYVQTSVAVWWPCGADRTGDGTCSQTSCAARTGGRKAAQGSEAGRPQTFWLHIKL